MVKFSPFCMPRPPEMMIFAAVSSGRSLLESSEERYLDCGAALATLRVSMAAEPPCAATGSNAEARTVMTVVASADLTVASALPA